MRATAGKRGGSAERRGSTERVRPRAAFGGFRPRALSFLRGLSRNNRRDWFEARRDEYEREVRQPMHAFIEEVDDRLGRFAPEIVGEPKRSMFRIHRDVRFSSDKSPYKAHAACWFFHRDAGKGVGQDAAHGGAGFYFHVEPNSCLIAGGIWMPPRQTLARIRDALAELHEEFEEVVLAPAFRRRFGALGADAVLRRMPRGYAASHPAAEWLRYCSFTVSRPVEDARIESPRLVDDVSREFQRILPLVRWLNGAIGLPAHSAR
jgi:uncharacterized protein (TIGR02453 family)